MLPVTSYTQLPPEEQQELEQAQQSQQQAQAQPQQPAQAPTPQQQDPSQAQQQQQPQQQQQQQAPSGWVPMPPIASQVATDPEEQQYNALADQVAAGGQQQQQQPNQQQGQNAQLPNVGPQTPPPPPNQLPQPPLPMSQIKIGSIKVNVPPETQEDDFDCGPTALEAILKHYGENISHDEIVKETDADPENGTPPQNLANVAKEHGLEAIAMHNMSIQNLKDQLDMHHPVILAIQAWGNNMSDYAQLESGHYVVAIGYDDKNIYFQDPSLRGSRGHIPIDELERRWIDIDGDGNRYDHFGLVIYRSSNIPGSTGMNNFDIKEAMDKKLTIVDVRCKLFPMQWTYIQ